MFMSMAVVCHAQDLTIEEWNHVDKILYPGYVPIISSQKLRYVPAETKMAFKYHAFKPFFDTAMNNRANNETRLVTEFQDYIKSIDDLAQKINQMSIPKKKPDTIEQPKPAETFGSKCFGILNSAYTFFSRPVEHIVQPKKEDICRQIDALLEQQRLLVRACNFFEQTKIDLLTAKGTDDVELSGQQFARCAQYVNPAMVLGNTKNEYADEIRGCFQVLQNNCDAYNSDGIDPTYDINRDPGNEICTVSYRPFHGIGIGTKIFFKADFFLSPYIKKCASYAGAYDGYGRDKSVFHDDPRYNAHIHGQYGAVFLLSPHEPGYDATQAGENTTWIRRNSQNELLWVTCNRYVNAKNGTPSNKQNFGPNFGD
jgi:hypothetical protein